MFNLDVSTLVAPRRSSCQASALYSMPLLIEAGNPWRALGASFELKKQVEILEMYGNSDDSWWLMDMLMVMIW